MSGEQRCKVKTCGAPLQSAIEKEYGKCTACLRKDRMKTANEVVASVKTAKIKTPSKSTCCEQEVDQEQQAIPEMLEEETRTTSRPTLNTTTVDLELLGIRANSIIMTTKVNGDLYVRALKRIEELKTTQSQYLRSLLEDSLGENWMGDS